MKKLSLMALLLAALGCSGSAPKTDDFNAKFNQLQVGQSPEQVKNSLGDPSLREVKEGVEIWHYSNQERRVEFKDQKVTGFSAEGLASSPTSEVPKVNLKLGLQCDDDKQCGSHYCHWGRCSGPNTCSADIGDRCANDQDCCSGFCDFAVCKKRP